MDMEDVERREWEMNRLCYMFSALKWIWERKNGMKLDHQLSLGAVDGDWYKGHIREEYEREYSVLYHKYMHLTSEELKYSYRLRSMGVLKKAGTLDPKLTDLGAPRNKRKIN
jgi:hypothetical protein